MASPTAGPSQGDTCDCDDDMMEVIYALGATSGLFLVLTIVCGIAIVALAWRLKRMTREARQAAQDETACPYWEDTPVPTLEETLSSQTKINSLGLGRTADTFYHHKSGHGGPFKQAERKKIRPKRSAPPPPKGGGKKTVDLEEDGYTTPDRYVPQPGTSTPNQHQLLHEYRQLDMVTVETERGYTQLMRGGSLPPMNLHSTSFGNS